jgi:hypothetical protein
MDINEIGAKQKELENTLSTIQLSYIHSKSIHNFLSYFDQINNKSIRIKIVDYLNSYFDEIQEKGYELTKDESDDVCSKYIRRIGTLYNAELNFKPYVKPFWGVFWGINIDFVLFVLGILKYFYYIPVTTVLFAGYFNYLRIFYKGRLYGLRY